MAIIQQKERELRYGKLPNLQQEAAVSSNYMRDMIRAYGVDLRYYKLKCPYPEIFKPILDMNKLTMHAYGYDPTPEYEVETPIIAYWQFSDDTLVLNQYGVQPNRVAKCWIDATDFAIAFAKKLSEYKDYKVKGKTEIVLEFDSLADFEDSKNDIELEFSTDIFDGKCKVELTKEQTAHIIAVASDSKYGGSSVSWTICYDSTSSKSDSEEDKEFQKSNAVCRVVSHTPIRLELPHVVPDFWKGKKYEDFIDDVVDSYLSFKLNELVVEKNGSFSIKGEMEGAIIYYDLNVVSKYHQAIKPDVGDVVSIPIYNQGDTVSRFEIVHIQGTKYNETYQNPFLRNYIYECDLRTYVSSGEKVPEERESEKQFRRLNELINFANSEAGRKISLYKDHEENVYGGYDKVSGLDGAILAANEEKGKTINSFENREDKGVPPEEINEENILSGDISYTRIADLAFPQGVSLVLASNDEEDFTKLELAYTDSCESELETAPWQSFLRCNDDTLVLRHGGRIYRLASMLEACETYGNPPTIKPRRLKRNVYAQRGGFNDQPFNLVDSEEANLDLGNYAETLTGPTAGEEYRGKQIKNSGVSRLIWRNTRSYMDVKLVKDNESEYYQLAVVFKGDRRNRRFPLATLRIN